MNKRRFMTVCALLFGAFYVNTATAQVTNEPKTGVPGAQLMLPKTMRRIPVPAGSGAPNGRKEKPADMQVAEGAFQPEWESLKQWECPEWFKDAKFGIWAHWGPQCQAEAGDWYARHLYAPGHWQNKYHVEHYGDPGVYGLKELCRDWKAERWDPEALVSLYKSVGARYFFTLGQHHDNFDLWDSPYQEWNSVNVGPLCDVVGEWSKACKRHNLPLGISMHGSHTWSWLELAQKYDGNLTKEDGKGQWWEGLDPQELYAQCHTPSKGWENTGSIHGQWEWKNGVSLPDKTYRRKFQNRVLQCIDAYQPDMLYFDDTVLPFYGYDDTVGQNILAHYYNRSAAAHDGRQQVVPMGKILNDEQKEFMLWDVERGTPDKIQEKYWQTCTCIGEWHYNRDLYRRNGYKRAEQVVDMLVDVVSKNGNLLLSVPMRGDGTIDEHEIEILEEIKVWMDQNGTSIYGTRPWKTFGEGPLAEKATPLNAQGFNERNDYSNKDVRFAQRGDTLFATILRWPEAGSRFTIRSLGSQSPYYSGKVKKVTLLGYGKVKFSQNAEGLTVTLPKEPCNRIAPVFSIAFKK